ncbi:MAG: copper chaperone PCu(A)C [Sphaerobacter sp.]|nr:copper chaperone PCu(A)C [Sphaerobacter sp.]
MTHSSGERMRWASMLGLVVLAVLALGLAAACGGRGDGAPAGLQVKGAWARPGLATPGGGMASHAATPGTAMGGHAAEGGTSAIFLTISNHGREADRLVGVTTDLAKTVEIHRSSIDASGVMRMEPIPGVDIPAGGTAELKPGAEHIMLIGLTRELKVGDRFPATLRFERAGEVTIEVEVREP